MGRRRKGIEPPYITGWGKPPVEHQFSSTNQPKRRPPKFADDRVPAYELEAEMLTVRRGGVARRVTRREAMNEALIQKALRNPRAARRLYARLDREEEALAQQAPTLKALERQQMNEVKTLMVARFSPYTDRLAYFVGMGLIQESLGGRWKVAGWLRQANSVPT